MLKMSLIIPFLFLICSALASEEISSPNQIDAGGLTEVAAAESRACGSCGGGTHTKPTSTVHKPDIHDIFKGNDMLALIISGLGSISVVVFNILGVVLLALLLKNLLSDSSSGAATDPYYYASQSSYADPLTYNKRSLGSSWSLQSIQESPFGTFLTKAVTQAIERYNAIEKQ